MYLIVVGLGGIGRALAGLAAEEGHSVVVIDRDEEKCADILEEYDLLAVSGNATDKNTLEDAGIDRADALVATTSDDALNLMACWLAKKYEVRTLVSIVNQKEHADLFKEVGVRISENPDEIVARSLFLWSENPDTQLLASIEGGTIFEITVADGAKGVNKTVREVSGVKDMLYIAIRRGGKLIIPTGDVVIMPDDVITVFTKEEAEGRSVEYMDELFR
ncbi:MAG: TrkA family potassium uptake protein [Methanocorpusculum sp.]|nr:TrkA family potassium uptake protein [Methanocorpusculum parvum]MBQ2772346.1 TrkA family potassium uptake protein [Methanocorpusculum sp.]MBQ4135107.1 TrkA family potassium uptake protein [Methanocorpusculum sp.]MBR4117332.1 TrkA family potassium uptake protein [Methanocorpusculum sp.]HJJ64482.1 TrkA family potassium uptake protein [Methanocorpusculum sp.]